MQRHGTLRRVQHKQFAPNEAQQRHLVRHLRHQHTNVIKYIQFICEFCKKNMYLEIGEKGDVAGPFDGREQETGSKFANVIDAHDVVGRLHALAVAGRRVRLRPQQQRNVTGQVAVRAVEAAVVTDAKSADAVGQRQLARETRMLRRWNSASLDS